MSKKLSRGIAGLMLILAAVFFCYALQHPEGAFPWSNTVTLTIYLVYFVVMVVLFIAPFPQKK